MKAIKIELKKENDVDYKELLAIVIGSLDPNRGISSDDVIKTVELKQQLIKSEESLHLSEPDYKWVINKLNGTVKWIGAVEWLAQFIKDVREAPTIEIG